MKAFFWADLDLPFGDIPALRQYSSKSGDETANVLFGNSSRVWTSIGLSLSKYFNDMSNSNSGPLNLVGLSSLAWQFSANAKYETE